MIQVIANLSGSMRTVALRPQNITAGIPQEAFAIDLDKLFTPSERKTIENMKAYMKTQGAGARDIEMLEGDIIHAKYSAQTHSNDIPLKEILGRQIRGIQDGYGNKNGPSLTSLQNLYDNFLQCQGVELFA